MDHDLFTLAEGITEVKSVLEEQFLIDTCSREKRALQEKLERRQELFQDLREKSIGSTKNNVPQEQNVSVLKVFWGQICELLKWLSYEPYIDDQPEIDEIWKICSALAKRGQLVQEDWKLRKEILRSIIENEYYDYYGCYDPMMELAEKLYTTPKEHFEVAHIMEQYKGFEEQAAQIYRQFGQEDKHVSYLEMHLDKKKENYLALLQYDQEHGNRERAMRTARLALEKCKDDLTDFFVFLLREAKAEGDEAEYKKLYNSAKRRRNVQLGVIEEALRQFRVE